ncbi:MAG: helix-turn-helix domain-containing protein [Candidatus Hydrogenedentes bacterium]|nr:helix-turn-helix domain-containing protein [Candidatus Hydrogenedentota bacterium]
MTPAFNPEPILARVSAVAREFGISASTLRRMADEGVVKAVRKKGHRYFVRASVYAFIFDTPPNSEGGPASRRVGNASPVRYPDGDRGKFRHRNELFRRRVADRLNGAA